MGNLRGLELFGVRARQSVRNLLAFFCAPLLLIPSGPVEAQTVERAVFARGVVDREPIDALTLLPSGLERLYYYTETRGWAGRRLRHQWLLDGRVVFELAFRVAGDRWRVWSSKRVPDVGSVTVRVLDDAGTVLREDTLAREDAPVARAVEIDVFRDFRYVSSGWPLGLSVGQTPAGGLSRTPMESLVREPPYRSREVFYGYLPLGNGADPRLTFVVDETEASSWVAWIDRNNNEDLTDDGAPCRNEGTGRLACLATVDIEVRDRTGSDHRLPYQLWFWLAGPDASAVDPSRIPWRPLFYARYHYEGTVALAGTRYRAIAYEMFNHDGVFSEADLCVDLDDDGRCADDERVAADGELAVGGFSYRIRIK